MDSSNKKGTHQPGKHYVQKRNGAKVGEMVSCTGVEYLTLTQARKAQKQGEIIVSAASGRVISVK